MSLTVWVIIGIIFVVVWTAIIIEIYTSPLMPDNYGIEEEELENKIQKEINSISPLFNDMSGIEVRKMMEKENKLKKQKIICG